LARAVSVASGIRLNQDVAGAEFLVAPGDEFDHVPPESGPDRRLGVSPDLQVQGGPFVDGIQLAPTREPDVPSAVLGSGVLGKFLGERREVGPLAQALDGVLRLPVGDAVPLGIGGDLDHDLGELHLVGEHRHGVLVLVVEGEDLLAHGIDLPHVLVSQLLLETFLP
jgi:hypothetical protein